MSRPRIRSLKPEAWQDERVGALSRDARLLFVGLITMADDEGRLRAQPSMLIGSLYPWDEVSPRRIAEWLEEIAAAGLIVRYDHDAKPYVAFRNWKRHQRINRPSPSLLPAPPDHAVVRANSVNDHGEPSGNSPAGLTPSRARGSDRIGKDQEPPQPPEQARGEQGEQEQAAPIKANPRTLGTNPRAIGARQAADSRALAAATAASRLAEADDKARAGWERLRTVMQDAVGDAPAWALYVEPLDLAGVAADGTLVLDGPDQAWTWHRAPALIDRCSSACAVRARLATNDEHAGLEVAA